MEHESIFLKLLDWAWVAVSLAAGFVWRTLHQRIDAVEKTAADRSLGIEKVMQSRVDEVTAETSRQRDVSAKIFDKLEAMSRESAQQHINLLNILHTGLSSKVDK